MALQVFYCLFLQFCYNYIAMKNKTHLYVSRKNPFTWLTAICMLASAATRITLFCMKGTEGTDIWGLLILPVCAVILYSLIILLDGQEHFYRTAIPMWLVSWYIALKQLCFINSSLTAWLCWGLGILLAVGYTLETSTLSKSYWSTLFLFIILACNTYSNHSILLQHIQIGNPLPIIDAFWPDMLMFVGFALMTLGTQVHPLGEYHPTWGDRPDGRRIRSLPPISQVSPYIMVNRNGADNRFETALEVSAVDRYIRKKRKEGLIGFGINHVLLAAYVRSIAKYPALNRFLSGQKVYTHGEDIQYCMTVKKEMTIASPDTVIKVHLSPYDTAEDVYRKFNAAVEEVKNTPLDSSFDGVAHALTMIPGVFLKFAVWLLKTLDYFGLLPKFLLEVSPFHGSVFFTSMGSLGIPAIYHHLYDFGNLPVFGAFGLKRFATEIQEDGTIVEKKYVDVKFTLDERIVDGYYYAAFLRHYMRIIAHPEVLDNPPDVVNSDID